ncbi:MAG: nitroreductase family protein [Halanaerobiales bacterium]
MINIIEAGRLSPSVRNEQPWKFGVINRQELIIEISKMEYNQNWIGRAKLLIVLCTDIVSDERGGRDIKKQDFRSLKLKSKSWIKNFTVS